MKKYFLSLLLFISIICTGQTKKLFKTASWGNEKWGFIYKPTTIGKYPVIFFFHGAGETGTDSVSVNSLLNIGPLYFVKNTGWKPNYIIVAIQEKYWSPSAELCKYILDNEPEVKNGWNGQTLWTGLSAGGQRVLECMANKYSGVFVPMSPAAIDLSRIDVTIPFRVLDFHADNDNVCPYKFSVELIDLLNKVNPGKSSLITYHGGHSQWNDFYNPNFNSPNIYKWAFDSIPLPPMKKLLFTLKVYDDGTTEKINN